MQEGVCSQLLLFAPLIRLDIGQGISLVGGCASLLRPIYVYFLCNVSAEKVNELQELLNKKDQEMKVMEDRYKKYLEKAKSVSCL